MKTKQIEAYGVADYTEQLYQGFKEGFKPDLETNAFAPVDIAGFFVCTLVKAEAKADATENFPAVQAAKAIVEKQAEVYKELMQEDTKVEPEVPVVASKEQAEATTDTSAEDEPEVPVKKTRKSKADKPTE